MSSPLRIAVVGATGAVGMELLKLLEREPFPIAEVHALASAKSAGAALPFKGSTLTVQDLESFDFHKADIAFFSAGAARSKSFGPKAVECGCVVIDNSSAFRMDPSVPLIVPEINGHVIGPGDRYIANPNCSAIIMLMAVAPLRKLGAIDRLIVCTYQSASGAGATAMEELLQQTREFLDGEALTRRVFPHPYAFNLFSHNTPIDEDGLNEEERKVIEESRKILGDADLRINVTCVRVPVLRAHSEAIIVEFVGPAPSLESVREAYASAPGVKMVDDAANNHFPMPLEASGIHEVLVGRIRHDPSSPHGLCLFVSGDQLLKGAALNAVQIAEFMVESGYIVPRSVVS
jgi:aspartate-semialdehyde dehydrogenase